MYTPATCPGPGDTITHNALHRSHPTGPHVDADDGWDLDTAADDIWFGEVVSEDGSYQAGELAKAMDAMPADMEAMYSTLIAGHQDQAAGRLMRDWAKKYLEQWSRDEAQRRHLREMEMELAGALL